MEDIKREYLTTFDVSYEQYEQLAADLEEVEICKAAHIVPDGDCAMCTEPCCSKSGINNV